MVTAVQSSLFVDTGANLLTLDGLSFWGSILCNALESRDGRRGCWRSCRVVKPAGTEEKADDKGDVKAEVGAVVAADAYERVTIEGGGGCCVVSVSLLIYLIFPVFEVTGETYCCMVVTDEVTT